MSEYAEEHIYLASKTSSMPGKYRNSFTPFAVEIMDNYNDPACEQTTVVGPTQVFKTQVILNTMAYIIANNPGPVMCVRPREVDVKTFVDKKAKPLLQACPDLARFIPEKAPRLQQTEFDFDHMTIYFTWSNTPAGLADKTVRDLFGDEVNKWPVLSGRGEGSPVGLLDERSTSYDDAYMFLGSTPTNDLGYISVAFKKGDQRKYWVPCPRCGNYITLEFGQLKWPQDKTPDEIREGDLAYYECQVCEDRILDHEKAQFLQRGIWVPKGGDIYQGKLVGNYPVMAHRSYQLNTLYALWGRRAWSRVAWKFLTVKDDHAELRNFINSWLAEDWIEKSSEITVESLSKKERGYAQGTVPRGVMVITAGIDVQKDYCVVVVRGWGMGRQSWLLDFWRMDLSPGRSEDWAALEERLWGPGVEARPRLVCIDARHRRDEVVDWYRRNPTRVRAIMGHGDIGNVRGYKQSYLDTTTGNQPRKSAGSILLVDSNFWKDKVHSLMTGPQGWHLFENPPQFYLDGIISEHKIATRNTKGVATYAWTLIDPSNKNNHPWDCEYYATFAAHRCGALRMRRPEHERGGDDEAIESRKARGVPKDTKRRRNAADAAGEGRRGGHEGRHPSRGRETSRGGGFSRRSLPRR